MQEQKKFLQFNELENQFFDNFYKSQEDKTNENAKSHPNLIGENFKKKLYEKMGINPNENNLILTEFGNKMWEIKKRMNNHMNYLKKKLFFEKMNDFFLKIIVENKLLNVNAPLTKKDRTKLKNLLLLLKPEIFSSISSNNMLKDGIKLLFFSQKQNTLGIEKKIKVLYKKIKELLSIIIRESLKNIKNGNKSLYQFMGFFNLDPIIQNDHIENFQKGKNKNYYGKEESEFSDFNLRPQKNANQIKNSHVESKKNTLIMSKTDINFPSQKLISEKQKKQTAKTKDSTALNIDKICYFYLDRLNLSGLFLIIITH